MNKLKFNVKRVLCLLLVCLLMTAMVPFSVQATEMEEGPQETTRLDVWDGSIATSFSGGIGTAASPYLISTDAEMALLLEKCKQGYLEVRGYYKLTSDLVMNADFEKYKDWGSTPPKNRWNPQGSFGGSFDGDGHTIYGLYSNSEESAVGLFSVVQEGSVSNLTISHSYIRGENQVGAICGQLSWRAAIINCRNYGIVQGSNSVGGIVGESYQGAEDCKYCVNEGEVTGKNSVGGIIGARTSPQTGWKCVSSSYNTGNVFGEENVGGIIGEFGAATGVCTIENCFNIGKITGTVNRIGGIAGSVGFNSPIKNCYNAGKISHPVNARYFGGIVGLYTYYSTPSHSYYLDTTCERGASVEVGYAQSFPLTAEEMKQEESFLGFNFDLYWKLEDGDVMPQLVMPEHNHHAIIQVIDSVTNSAVEGFEISFEDKSGLVLVDLAGYSIIAGTELDFAKDSIISISKDGYSPFEFRSGSLKRSPSVNFLWNNYVYLKPTSGEEPSVDEEQRTFIQEHIDFSLEPLNYMINSQGFQNVYWKIENGQGVDQANWLSALGDLADISNLASLKLEDLNFLVDYYDVFVSDLILTMTQEDVKTNPAVYSIYQEVYNSFANNLIAKIIKLGGKIAELDEDYKGFWEIKLSDIDVAGGWGLVKEDLLDIIDGDSPSSATSSVTTDILNWMFDDILMQDHIEYYESFFDGFDFSSEIIDIIGTLENNVSSFQKSTQLYIIAATNKEINTKLFLILTQCAEEIRNIAKTETDTNTVKYLEETANRLSSAIEKYSNLYNNFENLYKSIKNELINATGEFALETLVFKCVAKTGETLIKDLLGIPTGSISVLLSAGNFLYDIIRDVSGSDEKVTQYHTMYHIAPIEQALETLVQQYGEELRNSKAYNSAEFFDYAYRVLSVTNQYLYSSLYKLGASGSEIEIGDLSFGQLDVVMALATPPLHIWKNVMCHGNSAVIPNEYKLTTIGCPVDVYVYDTSNNLLASIVDEQVVKESQSVFVTVYNDKKSIMYDATKNYSIKITPRTEGYMDYSVKEVKISGERDVQFFSLPLEPEASYMGIIPSGMDNGGQEYALRTEDGRYSSIDFDSSVDAVRLAAPSGLEWNGNVAKWDSVPNASRYEVTLLRDGQIVSSVITEKTSCDFGTLMGKEGDYSFSIIALGNDNATSPRTFSATLCMQSSSSILLEPSQIHLKVGESIKLKAYVEPVTLSSIVWKSDNLTVASVNQDGKVSALSVGTAVISAVVENQIATCTVFVEGNDDSSVIDPPDPVFIPDVVDTANGSVVFAPSHPQKGDQVTITATPNEGYKVGSVAVTDADGKAVAVTIAGSGKYMFKQLNGSVTIAVDFVWDNPFTDINDSEQWYYDAVEYVEVNGLMDGLPGGLFAPNKELTRAEAVQILYNLEGQPDISEENLGYPYSDVLPDEWYTNAIYWARLTGVAEGDGDGTFRPNDSISRQECAQMMYNYANYKGYDLIATGDLSRFPDSGTVADWAETAMSWANGNQLINGHGDGTLEPGGTTTRAQAASILMRFDLNVVEI